jgi:hypothetical protein
VVMECEIDSLGRRVGRACQTDLLALMHDPINRHGRPGSSPGQTAAATQASIQVLLRPDQSTGQSIFILQLKSQKQLACLGGRLCGHDEGESWA